MLSSDVTKAAAAALLKAHRLEIVSAAIVEVAGVGTGIEFVAASKSGQLVVRGRFSDPQKSLALDQPRAAQSPDDEDELYEEQQAANEFEDEAQL